ASTGVAVDAPPIPMWAAPPPGRYSPWARPTAGSAANATAVMTPTRKNARMAHPIVGMVTPVVSVVPDVGVKEKLRVSGNGAVVKDGQRRSAPDIGLGRIRAGGVAE